MFCSLLIKEKNFLLKKRPTDYNPNSFWIVTVQDWPKTSPANDYCPLKAIDFSKVADIDNFSCKLKNIFCIFDNQRVKLARNVFAEHS